MPLAPPLTADDIYRAIEQAGPDGRASFAGQDLAGISLAGHWLRKIDFSGADLRRADLHGARLDGCEFTDARLDNTDLRGASLRNAWLKAASLERADLRDADLGGAFLGQAILTTAKLRGAWFDGVELSGTELPANWLSITRTRHADDDPFARRDIIAAVRRDLADDDPDAALLTLQHILEVPEPIARPLLEILRSRPEPTALTELLTYDLPPELRAALARVTIPPPLDEIGAELARLAHQPLATCQSRGLAWTMAQVIRSGGLAAVLFLRQITGLGLQPAKTLSAFAREQPTLMRDIFIFLKSSERGDLATAAALLTSETDELDFDLAVRTLWCLREALRAR